MMSISEKSQVLPTVLGILLMFLLGGNAKFHLGVTEKRCSFFFSCASSRNFLPAPQGLYVLGGKLLD